MGTSEEEKSSGAGGGVRRVMYIALGGPMDGATRQLCYMAEGLDRRRFEPVVLLYTDGAVAEHLRSRGVEVHVMPLRPWRSLRGVFMRYVDAFRVAGLARKRGVALVHASDMWKSQYALFVGKRLKVPTVIHVRGPITQRGVWKHGLSRASGVIAIARRYVQDLGRMGVEPSRVRLVDDAVDLELFRENEAGREEFRKRYGVGDRVVVGLVGRIEAFKKVLEFLEMVAAAERAEGNKNRAMYFVIGEPRAEGYLRQVHATVKRLGLEEKVVFTGRLEEMSPVLSGLDVLATLSGGSVMFEAMACGRTVLSVRDDGLHSEHTRHDETAWCVTTDKADVAAEGLVRVIGDAGLRERLGREGCKWVREHLAREAMVRKTEAFYGEMLKNDK